MCDNDYTHMSERFLAHCLLIYLHGIVQLNTKENMIALCTCLRCKGQYTVIRCQSVKVIGTLLTYVYKRLELHVPVSKNWNYCTLQLRHQNKNYLQLTKNHVLRELPIHGYNSSKVQLQHLNNQNSSGLYNTYIMQHSP